MKGAQKIIREAITTAASGLRTMLEPIEAHGAIIIIVAPNDGLSDSPDSPIISDVVSNMSDDVMEKTLISQLLTMKTMQQESTPLPEEAKTQS